MTKPLTVWKTAITITNNRKDIIPEAQSIMCDTEGLERWLDCNESSTIPMENRRAVKNLTESTRLDSTAFSRRYSSLSVLERCTAFPKHLIFRRLELLVLCPALTMSTGFRESAIGFRASAGDFAVA